MSFRYALAHCLLIGVSVAFLVHLGLIWHQSSVTIQEPRVSILVVEIALFISIIGLALFNLIKSTRR